MMEGDVILPTFQRSNIPVPYSLQLRGTPAKEAFRSSSLC